LLRAEKAEKQVANLKMVLLRDGRTRGMILRAEKAEAELATRTTIEIPEKLWDHAKRAALDERTSLRALIIEGLELRLKQKLKKGGDRR
jgi:hypothetical protein